MRYARQATGKETSIATIRAENPNVSIPADADCSHLGYPFLESIARPDTTEGQIVRQSDPEEYEPGKWRETWIVEDAPPAPIPQSVTRFQARAALHLAGLLESVETLMQSSETDMLAKLAWQDAQEFRRDSPTVLAMSQALGLTDAQIDALFITASGIEA